MNWMLAGKIVGAVLVASGLIGTGYVAAPSKDVVKVSAEPPCFKPKIYINGQEVKQK